MRDAGQRIAPLRTLGLAIGVALSLSGALQVTEAQQVRVPHIGYLSNSSGGSALDIEFFNALRELGWYEGRNIAVDARYSSGDSRQFPRFAAELVHLGVNVIVGWGPPPVTAAKKATNTIPIVMISNADPIAAGLVNSISRPGGNVTGVAVIDDLSGKRIELLKESLPQLRRVGVLLNPDRPGVTSILEHTKRSANALALRVQAFPANQPKDLERVFSEMKKAHVDAVVVLPDVMYWTHRSDIARYALKRGLPTMYSDRDSVEAGGLVSYSASFYDMARRAAGYVDKMLKGAKPEDLPVEQPTKFELVINMRTAKALGLALLPATLDRADEVIQ